MAREIFNEALAVSRNMGNPWRIVQALNEVVYAECAAGHSELAAAHFKEDIAISHKLGSRRAIAAALTGLATLALAAGSTRRAVRLWGCAEALRQESGAAMSPVEKTRYDGQVDPAKAQLSSDAFDQTWHEGRAMTLDQAVRYAMEESIGTPSSTA